MKKILLLFAMVLAFSACSNEPTGRQTGFDFDFSSAIGLTEKEVYEKLELTDDAITESDLPGRYDLKTPFVFEDMKFSEYLLFWKPDDNENTLYGGGYEYKTVKDEELYEKLHAIMDSLTAAYGEPVTRLESNKISDKEDFSELPFALLSEEWNGKDGTCEIRLNLDLFEDKANIRIEYQLKSTLARAIRDSAADK